MSLRITMPPMDRLGLHIPGGWEVKVPEVAVIDADLAPFVQYFMRDGYLPEDARRKAEMAMQRVWTRAWLQGLKEAIALLAKDYMHIHGTLAGFDPAALQGAYVPGDNTGRAGRPRVTMALVKMGQQGEAVP